jgi:hypothetical protein
VVQRGGSGPQAREWAVSRTGGGEAVEGAEWSVERGRRRAGLSGL